VDEAIAREWLMGTACRPADQRVAHFICEMLLRARAAGLTDDSGFTLPLTIEELAGTMGLTALHVGRLFQELRAKGLIVTRGKRLTVTGLDRLMECSGYSPLYLHQLAGDVLRPLEPRYREA
jgi:CRP-like cAMP-binding protein